MTDSQRIKTLIDYLKLSANKFAASIGVKSAGIYQIISGKYNISSDLADKIVRKYNNVSYGWLKTGKGQMLKANLENGIPPPDPGNMSFESVKIFAHLEQRIAELKDENAWLKRQIELKDEQIKYYLKRGEERCQQDLKDTKKKDRGGS